MLHFCTFLRNPHFDLEPEYLTIIRKPMRLRFQRYIVGAEIFSTFHARVECNTSFRPFKPMGLSAHRHTHESENNLRQFHSVHLADIINLTGGWFPLLRLLWCCYRDWKPCAFRYWPPYSCERSVNYTIGTSLLGSSDIDTVMSVFYCTRSSSDYWLAFHCNICPQVQNTHTDSHATNKDCCAVWD